MHYPVNLKSGQTLVAMLIFMIVAMSLTSVAVSMAVVNSKKSSAMELGAMAYDAAQNGAENAIIRLLRNPTYTGETLNTNGATVVITVVGSPTSTITSTGTVGSFSRTIEVVVNHATTLSVVSWKEK